VLFPFFWGRAPLRWCNHPISMKCCTVVCPCVGCVFSTFGGHILRGLQISDPKGAWGQNLGLSESHKPFDRECLENGSHRVTCQLGLNISSKDLSNMYDWAVAPRKVKVKVWTLVVAPLTWVRLVTSSTLQSQKWQLIGMSQWCHSALCGHPLSALMDNWTYGAAGRHTIAPMSHARPSSCSRSYYSFLVPLRVGGWVGLSTQ